MRNDKGESERLDCMPRGPLCPLPLLWLCGIIRGFVFPELPHEGWASLAKGDGLPSYRISRQRERMRSGREGTSFVDL